MTTRARTAAGVAVALALLAVGAWLRWEQLPWHRNVWGIDWLAYYEPQARHLRSGFLPGWLLSWEGLHPPASGVLHGGWMASGLSLRLHWWATVAASLGAPAVLAAWGGRRLGWLAGPLLLAWAVLSPLQANYGLNASPYPWMALFLAGSTVALAEALHRPRPLAWAAAAALSAAAAQVHVLALAAVGAQALFVLAHGPKRLRGLGRPAAAWFLLVGASAAFVVAGSLYKTLDPWTFHISEEGEPWPVQVAHVLKMRFGAIGPRAPLAYAVALGGLGGLLVGPRRILGLLGVQVVAYLAALAAFYELHVADPRLTHYFLVPQLLLLALGALGWGALGRWAGRGWGLVAAALAIGLTVPWALDSWAFLESRRAEADAAISSSAADELRPLYDEAGEGDVVAWLWDHTFLNDEPEYLDPAAAAWPLARLGRPCWHLELPRQRCNAHGGATFFFAPTAFAGEIEGLDEELRILVNTASAPGRARLVILPNEYAPPRPWALERWVAEHGGVLRDDLVGGVLVATFPAGLRIEEVPMHPGDPPPEQDLDPDRPEDPPDDPPDGRP